MSAVADTTVTIDLAKGCASDHCLKMAWNLNHQLSENYQKGAAVMPVPRTIGDWLAAHRTARKRVVKALRAGYRYAPIDRPKHADDVYDINTSTPKRQGRPMSKGYQEQPVFSPNPMLCPLHHVYTYGVLDSDDRLRAYLWLYRSGDLAMVSSILGHADHLHQGIMYLLYAGMVEQQIKLRGTIFYNLWDSGTDGLRFFKIRVGLEERDVDWLLT